VQPDVELTPTTDLVGLPAELRTVLGRLIRRLRSEYHYGLTQGAVLSRLEREGALCISELASAEHVRPQSMSQTLGELESDGLVVRCPDDSDGRRTRVSLTAAGRAAVEADRMAREGWLSEGIAGLTLQEQETLHDAVALLGRLASRD